MHQKKYFFIFLILLFSAFAFSQSKTKTPKQKQETVFVGETGKKYHRQDCRTLKKSTTITEYSISEAKELGYESCKVCNPPMNK